MILIPFVYVIEIGIPGVAIMPAVTLAMTGGIAGVSVQTVMTLCIKC